MIWSVRSYTIPCMDMHTGATYGPKGLDFDRVYSSREACRFAGVTYRQADYWIRKGLIPGMSRHGPGSGQARRWTAEQVLALYRIADKLDQAQEILESIGLSIPGRKTLSAA